MKENNLVMLVMTLTIGVILTGALLMPIIDDAQHDSRTVALNTSATYTMSDGDDVSFTLEKEANSNVILVNGEPIENHIGIIITANNFDVRAQNDGQVFITDLANNVRVQVISTASLSIAVTGTQVEYTHNTTTRTLTLEGTIFYVDGDGKYGGFFEGTPEVKVTKGESIYAVFFPIFASGDGWSSFGILSITDGEITDTIVEPVALVDNVYTEVTDPVYNIVGEYNENGDYWTYNRVDMTCQEFTLRRAEIIAPLEYSEITTTDGAAIALYGAIPVMVIVALLMTAIGAIAYRRAD